MLAASAASQEDPRPQDPAPPAAAAAAPVDDASDKAQTQSTETRETRALVTPDGSRFLLVRDMQQRHIHWALACWIDGRDDVPDVAAAHGPRRMPVWGVRLADQTVSGGFAEAEIRNRIDLLVAYHETLQQWILEASWL